MDALFGLIRTTDYLVVWYFIGLNTFYALLVLLSIPEMWKHWHIANADDVSRPMNSEALPPISVLMPAYNMEANIVESVRAQLVLRYPQHEVIVINDGSTDRMLERMHAEFDLYEVPPAMPKPLESAPIRAYYRSRRAAGLLVVDKENGGKADALNAGLGAARYPLVLAADADTIIETDALLRLVRPFLAGRPVAAAGGTIRIANGCRIRHARIEKPLLPSSFLAAVQVPEYLRAFLFGRLGWNRLGGNLVISGAFGLFRRRLLIEIGGYLTNSVVEDLDLVVRLHKHLREQRLDYEIPFIPDPVAWTEVPPDLRTLGRQRERWHRGLIGTMRLHLGMLFNRQYGAVGWIMFPFFLFGEALAPVVELVGFVLTAVALSLGVVNLQFGLVFLAVAVGYQILLSLWAVLLEEATFRTYPRRRDFALMLLYALVEPFGYRQLTVYWRLKGIWNAFRGLGHWGDMRRYGYQPRGEA